MTEKTSDQEQFQVRLVLEGEMAARFNKIKKKYGLESNADLVRLLITMEYDRITSGRSI
jgi:hypothetical protein